MQHLRIALHVGLAVGLALATPASSAKAQEAGASAQESAAAHESAGAHESKAAHREDGPAQDASAHILRALFTSGVIDREPVDGLRRIGNDTRQVYFYTELLGLAESTVVHRWEFNEQVMAEVPFQVGADRWRVWSSKQLDPLWRGLWKVTVIGADGVVLTSETFRYTGSQAPKPAKNAAAPIGDHPGEADAGTSRQP